jgi:hypothetical protein
VYGSYYVFTHMYKIKKINQTLSYGLISNKKENIF